MSTPKLTYARLREVLHYEPTTGVFTWLVSLSDRTRVGAVAGGPTAKGYWRVKVDGKFYRAHRLAWFYVHEVWPSAQIDHKFEKKQDNRISELRDASHTQNQQNVEAARKNSSSGVRGVSWCESRGKWRARIWTGEKRMCLGYFKDLAVAVAVRVQARSVYHPGYLARSN